MGSNLASKAQFERAKWRMAILGPLWVLQTGLALGVAGTSSWQLARTLYNHYVSDGGSSSDFPTLDVAWSSADIILACVATLCTFITIGRYLAESLTPWNLLVLHIIQLSAAGAMLAVDIVFHTYDIKHRFFILGIAFDCGLLVAAIATIIYAAVRHRRVMNRSYTLDVKHYGFSDEHEAKRLSDASSRRTSYASALRLSHVQPPPPAVYDTVPADEGATAGAYSHERNTDFDEYMARRQSVDTEGGGWRSRASSAGSQSLAAALAADRSEYVDVVLHPGGGGGSRRSSASTVRPAPGDRALHAVPEDTSSSTYSNDATESVLYQSPSRDANKDAAESLLGNRRASYEDCVVSSLPERIVVSPPVPPVQPGMYTSEPEWMRK